jgi:hypothetical protein
MKHIPSRATFIPDTSIMQMWTCYYCVNILSLVSLFSLGGMRLSPLGTSAIVVLLYQARMIDDDDYGAVGGMRIGRGNRSTRRKPALVPLCPPQIQYELTWIEPGPPRWEASLSYGTALVCSRTSDCLQCDY